MDTYTHSFIAGRVYNQFVETDLKLHKIWLRLGSIKQDYVYDNINHYKDETAHLFYQKYNQLTEVNLIKKPRLFSLKLGELFHYICDYFCYAHNQELLKNDMTQHFLYECKLNLYTYKLNKNHFNKYNTPNNYIFEMSFPKFIEFYLKKYLKRKPSYDIDIFSAYEVCVLLVYKLINEHKGNQNVYLKTSRRKYRARVNFAF